MNFVGFLALLLIPSSEPFSILRALKTPGNQLYERKLNSNSQDSGWTDSSPNVANPMQFPAAWWGIGLSSEVSNQPVAMKRFGFDLVLWRDSNGKLNIFEDSCPHRAAKLSLGQVVQNKESNESCLQCPFHGLEFDSQGLCQFDPEDKKPKPFIRVPKITAIERNDVIWMKWGNADLPEPDYLDKFDSYYAIFFKIRSKGSFEKNIKNQEDGSHVEFVHKNSFWRFVKNMSQNKNPTTQMTSAGILSHNGNPEFYFDLKFPNIWINPRDTPNTEDALLVMAAPIDSNTADVYFKYHRNFLKNPIIRTLVDPLIQIVFQYIAMEDQQIIASQEGNESKLGQKSNRLYRKDDQRIRYFEAYLAGKPPLQSPLFDRPSLDIPIGPKVIDSDSQDLPDSSPTEEL